MEKENISKVIMSLRDLNVKVSKKKELECIKLLQNIPNNIENLVYWGCNAVANERHGETEKRQGTITKGEYKIILNLDKNLDIELDEISKYVNMCCFLKDFYFSEDKEEIINFLNSGKDDYPLMDYIDYE